MADISLCMIVKNEEDTLGRCLESVHDLVDEIIIVDTGSTDKTKEIAAEFTDKIYDFEWIKDFSAARNFSFSHATKDYIMWLDGDDYIKEADRQKLVALKETLNTDVDVVKCRYDYSFDKDGNVTTVQEGVNRILKRASNPVWTGAIHETVSVTGSSSINSDFIVTHGRTQEKTNCDLSRNIDIYENILSRGEELSQRDKGLYANELYRNKRYAEAATWFEDCLNNGGYHTDANIRFCSKLSEVYTQLNDEESALRALFRSFGYDIPRPEACCGIGKLFFNRRRNKEAIFWFELALQMSTKNFGGIKYFDCYGYTPGIWLGCAYERLGDIKKAYEYNEIAGKHKPNDSTYLANKKIFEKKLNPPPYPLTGCDANFGKYFCESENIWGKVTKLSENLGGKETLFADVTNTLIRYKSGGKIDFFDLINNETKQKIQDRKSYMSKVQKIDDYFELNGYKLPENFFLSDVFYDRINLDKINTEKFKDKDIVDAGACLGDTALILSEYTNKNVYAFEPCEDNFNKMKRTLELNNRTNIIPVQSGLGSDNDELFLDKSNFKYNVGTGRVALEGTSDSEKIKIIKLDDFVEENNLDVGFIKVDIEGAEQEFLKGAEQTIKRFKPTISIAIYHNPDDFFNIKPIIESWDLGYKFKYISAYTFNDFICETVLIAETV